FTNLFYYFILATEIIKDYRNIDVLSSYAPFNYNNLKWAVIAEIDKEEALEPIYNLRNSIILLCLIVSIFIFGLVYFGSTKLTTPIIMLRDAATKISKGDYDIRVNNKNNDEIGELIDSFNNMAEQLSIQSKQIEQDKLLRISTVIDAQENERQRLSRDLHDGLGQMLLAVKMKLEQAKKSSNEKNISSIAEAIELIKNTIAEIRTISNDLMPTVLANFGLAEGLKKLCRDSLQNPSISFDFFCNNLEDIKLDEKKQIYIFRIIQELMNNIIKHSEAKEAQIKIFNENDTLNIIVKDNGMGFDSTLNKSGNGLKNILERTKLLNGSLLINSIINQGTTIQITIPVQYEKN
ncbi:MAG TPA: sensor histidine kinase, partial [Candidatus Kapabacteria bacterium]|nr:sensor histidine kinase [Candidatus Kapabacteria bacterium]